MAFKNTSNNQYLRFLIKEAGALKGMDSLTFFAEISRNEASRNSPDEFTKPIPMRITFTPEEWELVKAGATSFDDISKECYRCLRLREGFNLGGEWEDA